MDRILYGTNSCHDSWAATGFCVSRSAAYKRRNSVYSLEWASAGRAEAVRKSLPALVLLLLAIVCSGAVEDSHETSNKCAPATDGAAAHQGAPSATSALTDGSFKRGGTPPPPPRPSSHLLIRRQPTATDEHQCHIALPAKTAADAVASAASSSSAFTSSLAATKTPETFGLGHPHDHHRTKHHQPPA